MRKKQKFIDSAIAQVDDQVVFSGKKISTDKKSDSSRVIIDEIGFQVEEMDPEVKQKYKVNVIGVLVTGLFSGSEERIPVNLSKCK